LSDYLRGISVQQFDLTVTDTGKLAMALVDAGTEDFDALDKLVDLITEKHKEHNLN